MPENVNTLISHLFRHEAGRMVAMLTRVFGPAHLEMAEDVVQDALVEALTHWSYEGIPDNPSAWLMQVAKNKALNILKREEFRDKYLSNAETYFYEIHSVPAENIFTDKEITDDQLRMMFTCCHPAVSPDSQVALTLKTLCGFSIAEIAKAFLTTEENIHKRLVRARQKIRELNVAFEVPQDKTLGERQEIVLKTIYLLFNEGYSASSGNELIRFELVEEAIRLTELMLAHPFIKAKSNVYALLSLMLLNASRFTARQDANGNIITLADQNRSQWNLSYIQRGLDCLDHAEGDILSIYHYLAGISACHCVAKDYASTDWKSILALYNGLKELDHSPIVLLNRAIALAKVEGPAAGLSELDAIRDEHSMISYYLFYATKAELHAEIEHYQDAANCLEQAIELVEQTAEKQLMQQRLIRYREKLLA